MSAPKGGMSMTRIAAEALFVMACGLLVVGLAALADDVEIPLPEAVITRITISCGPQERINDFDISPDEHCIAVAVGTRVEVWSTEGVLLRTLAGHSGEVTSVSFHCGGILLAAGSADDSVTLWNAEAGQVEGVLTGHGGQVYCVEFSPDGRQLASGSWGEILIWDIESLSQVGPLAGATHYIRSLAFSPADGRVLISTCHDLSDYYNCDCTSATIWDVHLGSPIDLVGDHESRLSSAVFSGDGARIATCGGGESKVFDACTLQQIASVPGGPPALTYDGKTLAAGSPEDDRVIVLWDVETGQRLQDLSGHTQGIRRLEFTKDGRRLLSAAWDDTLVVWDTSFVAPIRAVIHGMEAKACAAVAEPHKTSIWFSDPDSDIIQARFSILEGPLADFTLDLTQPPYAEQVVDQAEGEFSFEIVPPEAGSYRIQLTLVDAAGLESEPFEFSFEAYTPTAPVVERVMFPTPIEVGDDQNGLARFEDAEGDIVEARFEVIEGDLSTIEIDPGLSFDPEVEGETDGAFRFTVHVIQAQTVTLRLTLVDAADLESNPYEFTFAVE